MHCVNECYRRHCREGAKLIDATVKAGGEGFKFVEQQKGEKASDQLASPGKKAAAKDNTPRASPASFRRKKAGLRSFTNPHSVDARASFARHTVSSLSHHHRLDRVNRRLYSSAPLHSRE